ALFDNNIGKPSSPYKSLLPDIAIKALLGVPLMREEQAIGALVLGETNLTRNFTSDDLEQAQAFAIQATIAIENARLYQETLGLQSCNEAIVQSIQQGIVVLDRTMSIRTINAFMKGHYGWEDAATGQNLFDYRPAYVDFLQFAIGKVLQTGQPEV